MAVPHAAPPDDDVPDHLQVLVATISSARPETVPACTIVQTIFDLQDCGRPDLAQRLIHHLVIEGHGYMIMVRGLAQKWADSGHNGFDADDLFVETQIKMIEGLEAGQKSALKWSSFRYVRFGDAKRGFNGRGGTRAKWEKALRRAADQERAVSPLPSASALDVIEPDVAGYEGSGNSEAIPPAFGDGSTPVANLDSTDGEATEEEVRDIEWKIERSLLDLLAWYRDREDLEERIGYEDLECWGRRVLDKIIAQIQDPLEREIATRMFVEDPPNLQGGLDDLGRPSVAASLGEKPHVVRHRHDKARAFVAERLLNDYINGSKLREADAAERSLLLAWYEARLTPRGRAD